jgi:hypothetical protein
MSDHTHHSRETSDQDHLINAAFEVLGPDPGDTLATDTSAVPIQIENYIAPRLLIADPEWINKHVVAKGRGTEVYIARIFGVARMAEAKTKEYEGKTLESVCLTGMFEAQNFTSGKVIRSRNLYLPNMYAKQVLASLSDAGADSRAPLDLLLGVRATGKTIPYAWTVTSFVDDRMGQELEAMRRHQHPMLVALRQQPSLLTAS